MDKAFAADTVDMGSITGLVKPKLERILHSHPGSRLDISNKMGSVKLSPTVVDTWANNNRLSKNLRCFSPSVDNLVNKNAITANLRKKLLKYVEQSIVNANFFKLFLEPASWWSGNAFVSEAGGLRFKSRTGQIERDVANCSPTLRHFFERSCVAQAQ